MTVPSLLLWPNRTVSCPETGPHARHLVDGNGLKDGGIKTEGRCDLLLGLLDGVVSGPGSEVAGSENRLRCRNKR